MTEEDFISLYRFYRNIRQDVIDYSFSNIPQEIYYEIEIYLKSIQSEIDDLCLICDHPESFIRRRKAPFCTICGAQIND